MADDPDFRSWEQLSAYLDGALDDLAAASVERAVRYDPALRRALDELRRQKAALQLWADEVGARPVPPHVRAMLERARREADDGAGHPGENPPKE